jgi:hypothetical protein
VAVAYVFLRFVHHSNLPEQHPDGVAQADPVQWPEVSVQNKYRFHCGSPPGISVEEVLVQFSSPFRAIEQERKLNKGIHDRIQFGNGP